jgi:hypothetical protein
MMKPPAWSAFVSAAARFTHGKLVIVQASVERAEPLTTPLRPTLVGLIHQRWTFENYHVSIGWSMI